jgi:N-acetyl-anhydromuramyl-L-alanine amidase AmpD
MKIIDKRSSLTVHPTKRYSTRKLKDIKYIAIHHSLTLSGSSEAFARYHVEHNDWPGIGYHYVIDKDGTIDFCNNIITKSAHVGNSNKYAIGICLIGNFLIQEPTEAQLQATADLCMKLIDEIEGIKEIKGHSDFPGYEWKSCPVIDVMQITNRMSAFRI